jgi:serine/threonine-protein kinase RsbW
VTISIPADPAFIGMLRSTVANIASRADFTIEEIEDLRMAVSEAATLLLPICDVITCELSFDANSVSVICRCNTSNPPVQDMDELPWVLLEALVDSATTKTTGDAVEIHLQKERGSQRS